MGLKKFEIVFDNTWNTFYPGQFVAGRILLQLDGTKKIRSINIKVKGEAETRWSSDKQVMDNEGRYRDETRTCFATEEYFKMQYYLLGSASGEETELAPGEHVYPFNFTLPPNLPSSFEADFGHVRYTVKAILDRPWKFDHEAKAAFTVISPLDLNTESRASEKVAAEMSKSFCCLFCASPMLNVNVNLPVRGYVPGQEIPIQIHVDNQSGVSIDKIKLILQKDVVFHARSPTSETKEESIVISEVSKGPFEGIATDEYEQRLKVPALPPSNLKYCGIIDLEYNLKVEACMSGWYRPNLAEKFSVFIGTIPLTAYEMPSAPRIPYNDEYPTKTGEPGFVVPAPSAPMENPASNIYPDLPPPSYEESMFGGARSLWEKGDSNFVGGVKTFMPRYPVYNFAAQ